jgi:hypothetical protein
VVVRRGACVELRLRDHAGHEMRRFQSRRRRLTGESRSDGVDKGRNVLVGELRVRGVVVSPRCRTQPDETNRRRAIREVDVAGCCDLGGCSSGTFDCGCFQVSSLPRFRQDALRSETLDNLTTFTIPPSPS